MVDKLAKKLEEDLNSKITKAFEHNRNEKEEEEIKLRDEEGKKKVHNQITEMTKRFSEFEDL